MTHPTPEHQCCPYCADDRSLELCLNGRTVKCVKCGMRYPLEKFALDPDKIRRREVAH
jgi:hypothetical protein